MSELDLIFTFHQPATLETAGGKGLNLMRLSQAGMPVPPGFIVTTAAYQAFVETNQLETVLQAVLPQLSGQTCVVDVSAKIRAAFDAGQFPPSLASSIQQAYQSLCAQTGTADLPVAVRSSATAEDLAEASFAGQQDTYLNISGADAVLDAVRRCFGSLWSERAIAYRSRQGLSPLAVNLAVVIQQMVFAEAAGVAFTANPLSGDPNQMIIDATWGLGESIVSGLVTPDHIVMDKRSGKALSYAVAEKTVEIIPTKNGTQEHSVSQGKRRARVLAAEHIQSLKELGQAIEKVYGRPQDLEWCLARGKLYIVQARPITTLPDRPVTWDAPGEGQWLHGGGTFEMITEPISPLFETFLLPIFVDTLMEMLAGVGLKDAMPETPYKVINGHIYLHMDLRLRPWHLPGIIRDFALHLNSMQDQEAEQVRYRQAVIMLDRPLSGLNAAEIIAQMHALGQAGMLYWVQIMKVVQVIYRQESAFTTFYRRLRRAGDPEPEIFLRGQKITSWEAECSTFELAQLARKLNLHEILLQTPEMILTGKASDAAASEWRSAFDTHLERFGHQLSSFDLALPTLMDDPRPVITAIQAFLSGKQSPYDRQQRMADECNAAIRTIDARLSDLQQVKFRSLLSAAQHAARTREDAIFDVGLAWTPMHRAALELGKRLVGAAVIAQPGDLFWLTLEEIRGALDSPAGLKARVAERQANANVWSKVEAPYLLPVESRPAFWWGWIFPTPELQRHPDAHTLVGLGVSPGKVTAVARVIHSLDEMDNLHPGEILVARSTTPAWTPLFARAAGLVTDLGGPLAHGSIVAREVGIPAVMGTGTATHKIQDGQTITILGAEGKVLLNPA